MAWIAGAQGIFKLHNSDAWCGSLVTVEDAAEIVAVTVDALEGIPQKTKDGTRYIVELDLHRAWSNGRVPDSPFLPKVGNATVSLDELILKRLVEITLPGSVVEQQVKFGRKRADLQVEWNGVTKIVEFVGPSHFIAGQYAREPVSPLERKKEIEDHFGVECVIWPFWMQRCARNVRAMFDEPVQGLAAVWSSKGFFGDFVYPDSALLIEWLTERFDAITPAGIGYMYGNDETPNKPVHPIVEKIRAGKESPDRLIPRGNTKPGFWWLPPGL